MPIAVKQGGVATSSNAKRAWDTDLGNVTHLRDPKTGGELSADETFATVIADKAVTCEILTKTLVEGNDVADYLTGCRFSNGNLKRFGNFSSYELGRAA